MLPIIQEWLSTDLPQSYQHSEKLSDAMLSKSRLLNVAFILFVQSLLWQTVPQRFRPTRPLISSICVLSDLVKILLSKGEIGDADFDRFEIRNNENSFKDQCYIPRRRGVIMTNVEVFQKGRDLLVAKHVREATKTLGKQSKKAGNKVQTSKKHREELNDIPGSEPLLLRIRLPTESV